jgi:hypothetical protein
MSKSLLSNKAVKAGISLSILSATGALAYYFFHEEDKSSELYSDENLVAVLERIHRNYFPIFLRISK